MHQTLFYVLIPAITLSICFAKVYHGLLKKEKQIQHLAENVTNMIADGITVKTGNDSTITITHNKRKGTVRIKCVELATILEITPDEIYEQLWQLPTSRAEKQ